MLSVNFGKVFGKCFYAGIGFDYWFSRRNFFTPDSQRIDTLNYQGPLVELGYLGQSPRTFYLVSAGVSYPLSVSIISTGLISNNFSSATKSLGFHAKIVYGVNLFRYVSLLFDAGYRYLYLGTLTGGGQSFLETGESLKLSGPFLGIGLGVHF